MNPGVGREKNIMELSVVIPVYNEAPNLIALYNDIAQVLGGLACDYEVIFVDDGSIDGSFAIMKDLAMQNARVKVLALRRNFGQTAAMAAGFDVASGQVIVPMDADLQNDPRDIPQLLEKLEEGFDVVSGWRAFRKDRFFSRRVPSLIANKLISRMTGVSLHDYGCTLKAYRRNILEEVNLYGEMHRFVPALASQVGARVAEISVHHRPRKAGVSKYGLDRTIRVVLDLVTVKFLLKYSTRPLQLFGKWAIAAFVAGSISGIATLYMKFFEDLSMNRNPLLILTAFLLFSSLQFIMIGLLGELTTRTYHEVQGKPIYSVKETVNIES